MLSRDAGPEPGPDWIRALRGGIGRWFVRGLDLVYPPKCPICRLEARADDDPGEPRGEWDARRFTAAARICEGCARELSADVPRCSRCGEPGHVQGCRPCRQGGRPWRQIAVLSSYGGRLRESVLRAKRPAGADVAAALATLLVEKHRDLLLSWEVSRVVPVPMHWMRRSLRGMSAADELALGIASQLARPCSRPLVRHRRTPMQNELPFAEREANVANAFRVRHRVAGERILLVDDVLTTGATASACCRALVAAGAASVDVVVAARADHGGSDS